MSKISLLPIVYSLAAIIGFTSQANAQAMCVDIFNFEKDTVVSVDAIVSDYNSKESAEFKKLDNIVRRLGQRIGIYSELSGSETNRSLVEAETYAVKIKDQVRLGLTRKVVEKVGPLFKRYEVDIRMSEVLKGEIALLEQHIATEKSAEKRSAIEKVIKGKQAEANVLYKHIGRNYYKYITLKEALSHMTTSKVTLVAQRAQEVINELQALTTNHASMYGLDAKSLSISDIKRFVQSNVKAERARLKRAAVDELFLTLKLLTLSGPVVNGLKSVVYKIPEKIVMGPFVVSARKVISEALQIGYNKHLRSNYLEDIEMIIEATSPAEQFELLRSLNVKSERPDELIEVFSRIVENTEEWEAIKSYASTKALENERYKQFYDRMMAADKVALTKDAFPLYYEESGANSIGKIVFGSVVAGYMGHQYVQAHPDITQSFMNGVQNFQTMIQGLF